MAVDTMARREGRDGAAIEREKETRNRSLTIGIGDSIRGNASNYITGPEGYQLTRERAENARGEIGLRGRTRNDRCESSANPAAREKQPRNSRH